MVDEPFFPKPEGPVAHVAIPRAAEPNGEAPTKTPPPPAGADGFAVENTFLVTDVIDNTGQTQINVESGDVFGQAEAASPMMFPNLAETGFVIPTWPGSRFNVALSNLGTRVWANLYWSRWIATKTVTIGRLRTMMNAPVGCNANSNLAWGLYNETGTQRFIFSNLLHVNTDLGADGTQRVATLPAAGGATYKIIAGQTYVSVIMDRANMTNGIFVAYGAENWQPWSDAMVKFNGGNPAVNADKFRWGMGGIMVGAVDPASMPADLTPVAANSCNNQDAIFGIVAP